ncbi:MAG: T9SS type A sorting domain-containing protein [Bacteroidota bacterium]
MRKFILPLLSFFLFLNSIIAQTGCSGCELNLPELPVDTIFISELPDGILESAYEADVSFRLPKTTTPVAERDSTVTPGFTINEIVIKEIRGLPEGMNWEAAQDTFNVEEQTDGCAKICGTPLERGQFRLEIILESRVFLIRQESSAFLDLFVAPSIASSAGFAIFNNSGCGMTRASFRNNNPSQGEEGFQYFWDFGNGETSTEENPAPQEYFTPGTYEVTYQAIIDTAASRLQAVTVLEGDCTDLIGKADYYISIVDPDGTEIYVADHFENPDLPVTFELDVPLQEEGNYMLFVKDEDRGLEGSDDNCATIPFNFQDSTLTLDGVVATLDILNPIDTIMASDSVFVLPFPPPPRITFSAPDPFCTGGIGLLEATPYEENLQWSKDNQIIAGAVAPILEVTESGRYAVSYASDAGCVVLSPVVQVNVTPLPVEPIFENVDNLLMLLDETLLNEGLTLQWYLNEVLLEGETEARLCTEESGIYTLEITNTNTGCINRYSREIEYDAEIENCNLTNSEELVLKNFRLYPNPTSAWLNVEFEQTIATDFEVYLFDVVGKNQSVAFSKTSRGFNLNLEHLPTGIYWLQLRSEGRMITRKVIKQ